MNIQDIPTRSERETYIKDKCMELLDKYGDNPEEHGYQLALFVAKEMESDYKPKVFDGLRPEILDEYESLSELKKIEWNKQNPEWRRQQSVQEYFNAVSSVHTTNQSNKEFIQECLQTLDKIKNPVEHEKLTGMLAEFEVRDQKVAKIDWNN